MSAPVMIVDGDSLTHRAYHGLPKSIRHNAVAVALTETVTAPIPHRGERSGAWPAWPRG